MLLKKNLPKLINFWVCFLIITFNLSITFAQTPNTSLNYQVPPKTVADLVDVPPNPTLGLSPRRTWAVLAQTNTLPSIDEISQPELRIAGIRINPRSNGPKQLFFFKKISLVKLDSQEKKEITGLPSDPQLSFANWAPDEKHFALANTTNSGIELWLVEVATAQARKLTDAKLNWALSRTLTWLSDSKTLVSLFVPENRGNVPVVQLAPNGPVVQESIGKTAPTRTFQDLLKNSYDEEVFEHYATSYIGMVSLDGKLTRIGNPGVIRNLQASPDGTTFLVQTTHKPYSYSVPSAFFPNRVELWSREGKLIRQLADLPLSEQVPVNFDSVLPGPRAYAWRSDVAATLCWAEAQDKGDATKAAEVRDKVFSLAAPFNSEPTSLASLAYRYAGSEWSDKGFALVSEFWNKTRATRTWIIKPDQANQTPSLLFDYSYEDRYADPGSRVLKQNSFGRFILMTSADAKNLYLTGEGASTEGDRPFLDRLNLETRKTERLWRSEAPYYEFPSVLLDSEAKTIITQRESKTEPPNYYIRDLANNKLQPLTNFPHPTPQFANIQKEQIRYKRADGVDLTATLYLPQGYSPKDGPLPLVMWAYPQEFKSAAAASQVTDSPYRFVRLGYFGPQFLLALGYAVLDDPTMPIIGEGDKEPNDTYLQQLVSSAQAAVDEVVRRGVADRDRIAIGGHSYGAFMTANLLAHSRLFRAGIARSGAYNRTLTPFGFQAEERTFWQAPDTYIKMSPFVHADKIKDALLIIHGQADSNPGTFPIQSERLYQAVKGLGGTVRLVMLPNEDHGYQARESILHMQWEMIQWLDKYVKNAKARE
ncbi:MAG: S9 family peptidase [Acidobacteria bacterium]|nr:S9 family peptidase [Acidobacteriota bacterium]